MYMRNVCLRILTLALGLIAFVGASNHLHGQQYVELIKFTNTWRYNQSGANLGPATNAGSWGTLNYDDTQAGWSGGPALLAVEDVLIGPTANNHYSEALIVPNTIPTPLSLTSGGGTNGTNITYYFRTRFTNTLVNLTGVELWATNLVDDGCVIYVNGFRVGDVRLANATPNYLTFASAGPTIEGQYDPVSIPINRLQPSVNNIMAVEVHQSGIGSSDITFAMKLVAIVPTQLTITNQPQSITAVVGETVAFSIGVSGGPVVYRWYRNGAFVSNATNAILSFTAQTNLAGSYYCVVSNAVSPPRTSSVVALTVVEDAFGPEVVSAIVADSGSTNVIQVQLSENLSLAGNALARDTNNYRVVVSGTTNQFVPVVQVQLAASGLIILRVGTNNWNIGGNYYLLLNNIEDAQGNRIAPNTVVGVSWNERRVLTQMSDFWRFYDCADPDFCDANSAAVYANEAWTKTNFVMSSAWGVGQAGGIYYHDTDLSGNLCAGDSLGQAISYQPVPTLFRRTFVNTSSVPVTAQLRFRQMVDDGLVVFLNGVRIYSTNAPAGAVTFNSRASVSIGNAICVTNNSPVTATLLPGTNWLAAAVLNVEDDDQADTVFGLEIEGSFPRTSPIPSLAPTNLLRITQTRLPDGTMRFSWPVSITPTSGFYGFHILWSSSFAAGPNYLRGLYFPNHNQVTNQSNPYTNSVGSRLFRLGKD
jgi:hypothetical protein